MRGVAYNAVMLHRLQHDRYGRSPRSRTPRPRRRGHPPRPAHRGVRGDARRMGAATTNTIPQSSHHRLPPDPGPPSHGIHQRIPLAVDLRGHRSIHRPPQQQTAADRRHHRTPLREHPANVPAISDRSPLRLDRRMSRTVRRRALPGAARMEHHRPRRRLRRRPAPATVDLRRNPSPLRRRRRPSRRHPPTAAKDRWPRCATPRY